MGRKIKLVDSFEQEKYNFFFKSFSLRRSPDKIPKSIYNEIHREFARRLNSMNGDEKWVTFEDFIQNLITIEISLTEKEIKKS